MRLRIKAPKIRARMVRTAVSFAKKAAVQPRAIAAIKKIAAPKVTAKAVTSAAFKVSPIPRLTKRLVRSVPVAALPPAKAARVVKAAMASSGVVTAAVLSPKVKVPKAPIRTVGAAVSFAKKAAIQPKAIAAIQKVAAPKITAKVITSTALKVSPIPHLTKQLARSVPVAALPPAKVASVVKTAIVSSGVVTAAAIPPKTSAPLSLPTGSNSMFKIKAPKLKLKAPKISLPKAPAKIIPKISAPKISAPKLNVGIKVPTLKKVTSTVTSIPKSAVKFVSKAPEKTAKFLGKKGTEIWNGVDKGVVKIFKGAGKVVGGATSAVFGGLAKGLGLPKWLLIAGVGVGGVVAIKMLASRR